MPDIELLQMLGKEFSVSINELLAGQYLSDEEFRKQAEENIIAVSKESAFSLEEKKKFWIKKWRKEHMGLFVLLFLVDIALVGICFAVDKSWLISFLPLLLLIEYMWQNNRMMIYVENHIYEKKD